MEELIQQMKVVLADTVAFYQKAHQFHWNVEGDDFYTFHKMFQEIYEEVYGSVDTIGEQIRALDAYAPLSPRRIADLTNIMDADVAPMPEVMVRVLFADNQKVMNSLMQAYKTAERFSEIGLSNFLQDRYNAHKKHQFFLRATMKEEQ